MPDKKKMAMMIIKKKFERPSGESSSEKMEQKKSMCDYDMGYEHAAEKMISAMQKKDAKMLKSCLKDFIEMCMHENKEEEDDEESMEYDY